MTASLTLISSMATRQLLTELAQSYQQASGVTVTVESVGGVDAARRVQAGEAFDLVVLASDAMDKLAAEGCLLEGSRRAIVDSSVAIAVRSGTAAPDISTEDALRTTLLQAQGIAYSTGPSGTALLKLFARWGLAEQLQPQLVQARPGVPVGSLVAEGVATIGFQQLSELMNLDGITVLAGMPPGLEIVSRFVGAVGIKSQVPAQAQAQAFLNFMCAEETKGAKRRHGMEAPKTPD
ncbi:substrate-binding domain-containing protein [Roseateles koreensis]|uniref:Substrate-binding domain-containing protein n=1 Tax=Roseateles koreensis TaxID=2987526 RepID=A0ABT5KWD8_9BURK|nr:substrate-binding domain-containing protein [Roseateles koreensis]MDC8787256.1 substrate-binding domain-containing protein [Roseateles koreensis]